MMKCQFLFEADYQILTKKNFWYRTPEHMYGFIVDDICTEIQQLPFDLGQI